MKLAISMVTFLKFLLQGGRQIDNGLRTKSYVGPLAFGE